MVTVTLTLTSGSKSDFTPPGIRLLGFGGDVDAFRKPVEETVIFPYVKVVYVNPNPKGKRGSILLAWKYR